MRAFLAIPVPEEAARRLATVAGFLKIGRPVPAEDLHLTLAFLDEQPDATIDELHYALDGLRLPRPTISFGLIGTFERDRPTTIHAEVKSDPDLEALHRAVQGAVRAAGITLPHHRFRPHVTLARLPARLAPDEEARLARTLQTFAATPLPDFAAERLMLYRSTPRPSGAVYDPLADYSLVQAR